MPRQVGRNVLKYGDQRIYGGNAPTLNLGPEMNMVSYPGPKNFLSIV